MPPAVLLLHGFTHTGASWDPVVTALGERYRAMTPDIRGHGSAADARPVILEAVLADLEAMLADAESPAPDAGRADLEIPLADGERTAPARFTLVGYSMGGRIAMHLALALQARGRAGRGGDAARLERLILIGASPGIADPTVREQRRRSDGALAAEIERSTIDEVAERWAATPILAGLPDDIAARVHEDRLRSTPAGLARALRGLGTGVVPSLWNRLGELQMPVALVVGERDQKFRVIAAGMAQRIPAARIVVVPGTGHAVHLEAPECVVQLIVAG